jgi:excisionase family DNA binding protein
MPEGESTDRFLTTQEVADVLGVTVEKAKYLIQRRRIPVVKWGRWNRVRASDLNAFIANRKPGDPPATSKAR